MVGVKVGLNLAGRRLDPAQVKCDLEVKRENDEVVATVHASATSMTEASFLVDTSAMAPGPYGLSCTVRTLDGQVLGSVSGRIQRVEKIASRKAFIDSHQRLILDGEPFFPWAPIGARSRSRS